MNNIRAIIKESKFQYLLSATILYCLIGLVVVITAPNPNPYVIGWQVLSISFFFGTLIIGLKLSLKNIFITIFLYQIIMSIVLHVYFIHIEQNIMGYNADTELYFRLAAATQNHSIFQSLEIIKKTLDDPSDHGFPLFLKYVYAIGGNDLNTFRVLLIINCVFQTLTCIVIAKISSFLGISRSNVKWIVLMWGLNSASIYLNVSGLKEPLFVLLCTSCMYSLYKIKTTKPIRYHMCFFLLVASIWLFRYYISLFFIIIYMGYVMFPKLWNNLFAAMCIVAFIVCIGLTEFLVNYFPEINYAIMESEQLLPGSKVARMIYYLLAFLSPIPKFYSEVTLQEPLLVMFAIEKFSFSVFALIGAYVLIKKHETKYYPLMAIILFNTLLLIVSAHLIEYRYSYIILPMYFILMIESFSYRKRLITNLYLIFSCLIVFFFNMKIY